MLLPLWIFVFRDNDKKSVTRKSAVPSIADAQADELNPFVRLAKAEFLRVRSAEPFVVSLLESRKVSVPPIASFTCI